MSILHRVRIGPSLTWLVLGLSACGGKAAPDADVCRDLVHRLCLAPRCPLVDERLSVVDDCEATLLARTGCGADEFAFESLSRRRFLDCRAPVLRSGLGPEVRPACEDVAESFDECPDLVGFLRTGAP
ncbi:MAG: hypothetical protein ACOZIN_00080 [Myxococcota bacterium]